MYYLRLSVIYLASAFSICIQSHEGSSILENFISRIESTTNEKVFSIILKNCEGVTIFTFTIPQGH